MNSNKGRFVAYVTMLAMLALSIAGNVSHTLHLDSTPSVRSIVYAIMWPVMVWLGVEMFVRVEWSDLITHKLVRWVGILLVSSIAALVSYQHLRGLLKADGEDSIVYNVGPLAIDGLMLMATLALLLTRKQTEKSANASGLRFDYAKPIGPMPVSMPAPVTETLEQELERITLAEVLPQPQQLPEAPVSPAPSKPRASNGQTEELVRTMLEDPTLPTYGSSTIRRYASVARTLRDNPQADLGMVRGVRPDIVENIIRPWAMSERVR